MVLCTTKKSCKNKITHEPNADETIMVRGQTIYKTQLYIYLGQSVTLDQQDQ